MRGGRRIRRTVGENPFYSLVSVREGSANVIAEDSEWVARNGPDLAVR